MTNKYLEKIAEDKREKGFSASHIAGASIGSGVGHIAGRFSGAVADEITRGYSNKLNVAKRYYDRTPSPHNSENIKNIRESRNRAFKRTGGLMGVTAGAMAGLSLVDKIKSRSQK